MAAEASTVHPLPFRSMGTYPYPKGKSFPLDDSHVDYFLNYNTRHLSGNEPKGYRFELSALNVVVILSGVAASLREAGM